MKYIYLDQNWWIYLAKGWYEGKGTLYELVSKIRGKIDSGDLIVVLSLVNVLEARKIENKERREKLLNFMVDFSNGNVISPFTDWVIETEVLSVIFKKLGKNGIDMKSKIIGKGISLLIGAKPTLVGDIPEEKKKEIIEKINSVETMRIILPSRKSLGEDAIKEAEKFEEVRKKERTIKDKEIQYKVVMGRFLHDFIFPKIILIYSKLNLPKEFIVKELKNKDDWVKFLQQFPASYSYFSLTDLRDRDLSKKIEDNDLYDLFGFTMGVSYCDVFFGEKRFVALAKQAKLDELYNTIITSSLDEFKKAIF